VCRLELARLDHPEAAAGLGAEGGDEVTGLGHRVHATDAIGRRFQVVIR